MNNTAFFADESHATLNPNMKVYENPFPEKMARAVAFFEKNGLPPDIERPKTRKKATRSTLQNELLTVFSLDPSEAQMQELKAFLYLLFGEQIKTAKTKKEVEMA
jgi:hypothetical protein